LICRQMHDHKNFAATSLTYFLDDLVIICIGSPRINNKNVPEVN
jgi:hypothetical protein